MQMIGNPGHRSPLLFAMGLFLSVLFCASHLRAEEGHVGKRALPGEACQVQPRDDWTPQEKWVWKQVCEGKTANFNATEGYGGTLDPKGKEDWPDNRVLRPEFLKTILLYEPYRSALTRKGVWIVGALFKMPLDLSSANLSQDLLLIRSKFGSYTDFSRLRSSKLISLDGSSLFGKLEMDSMQVEGNLFMRGGARFAEVDLGSARIGGQVSMIGSTFDGTLNMDAIEVGSLLLMREGANFAEVILRGAKIGGQIDMRGSTFSGKLNMDGIQVGESLLMREQARFAEVVLRSAGIGGHIDMDTSTFNQKLDMDNIQVGGGLFMREGARFAEVILRGAKIGGQVSMIGSTFNGKLNMDTMQVGSLLLMRGGAEFAEVILRGAKIGGQIDMRGSTFNGPLNMDAVEVGSLLLMREQARFAEVILRGAKIGGQIDMTGSTFDGKLNMDSAQLQGSLFMRGGANFTEVDLIRAGIGGQVSMTGSRFGGTLNMDAIEVGSLLLMGEQAEFAEVILRGAKIGGQVSMIDSTFNGKLNMDSIQVGESIFLYRARAEAPIVLVFGKVGRNLGLSGAKVAAVDLTGTRIGGELQLGSGTHWQQGAKLTLRNVDVGALESSPDAWPDMLDLEGFRYGHLGGIGADDTGDPSRDISWLEEWLERHKPYSPQPYEQLASALRQSGDYDKANKILYAGQERRREQTNGFTWFWLTLQKYVIGYGYGSGELRSLIWVGFFILLGALVIRINKEGRARNLPWCLSYSLDMILPIIRLDERHYEIELDGFAKYYFYFHILMGYLLASFVIAAISGLTK
jgi:uncharacterized protein YjbI with pentapeptide repeats